MGGGIAMMISNNDSRHDEMKRHIKLIANICISESFLELKKELELLYKENGSEQAAMQAFQDALYTILAEEDVDYLSQRAY